MIVWWDVHTRWWYLHYSTIMGVTLWGKADCDCGFRARKSNYDFQVPLSLVAIMITYVYTDCIWEKRLFDDSRWEIGSNRNANARFPSLPSRNFPLYFSSAAYLTSFMSRHRGETLSGFLFEVQTAILIVTSTQAPCQQFSALKQTYCFSFASFLKWLK